MHEPCEHCKNERWIFTHHWGDGHGGLLGGVREDLPCGDCNRSLIYPRRPDYRTYYPKRVSEQGRAARTQAP